MSPVSDAQTQTIALRCMEVWGGNRLARSSISVPGIDAWLSSTPYRGDAGGGDIHYLSSCAAGVISRFALADVAGHGQEADAMAVQLRNLMRRSINTPDQTRIARALNTSFASLAKAGRFATALLATYYAPTDHLVICNAGHPRPLWYHKDEDRWEILHDALPSRSTEIANLPLGIIDPTDYAQFAVPLAPGDVVVLYTDALIEAADPSGAQLGEAGLRDLVSTLTDHTPEALGRAILDAVDARRAAAPPDDDSTIIVLAHTAQDPPRQSLAERITVMTKVLGLASTTRSEP